MKKSPFAVIMLIFLFSCKKNNPDEPCVTTTASVAGTYKQTSVTYKASATAIEEDYFSTLWPNACDRDNLYLLNANETYQYKDAGAVCSSPGDDNGTWSITANTLVVDGQSVPIKSFDCSALVFTFPDYYKPGDVMIFTWTRQ